VTTQLDTLGVNTDDFLLKDGCQYKAFVWLSNNMNLATMNEAQQLQRYALATLYYATNNVPNDYAPNPGPWVDSDLWLTDESECDWALVSCNAENKVGQLMFEKNNLSGKLPPDLALIRNSLLLLDLTSNLVHMKDNDFVVFDYLHRLKDLDLQDNFLESRDGLPRNFKSLSNLEELKASYNLMSGPLDNGVLETLQKLTHLEIESNFFTVSFFVILLVDDIVDVACVSYLFFPRLLKGALPFLGQMPNLVYIYLRRNNLSTHLNFLKNTLPNLFSVWLDGNDITRTIPTQVGQLTSLASLCIASASLMGTLPTELALLPILTRVWLHGNDLTGTVPPQLSNLTKLQVFEIQDNEITGTMPAGVCKTIANSDYTNKSLVADCSEVQCSDCCTKCAKTARVAGDTAAAETGSDGGDPDKVIPALATITRDNENVMWSQRQVGL